MEDFSCFPQCWQVKGCWKSQYQIIVIYLLTSPSKKKNSWKSSQQSPYILTQVFNISRWVSAESGSSHLSAVLHVFLQTFNRLPAHTFTLRTTDSAFGHNLELPTFLLTSWKRKDKKAISSAGKTLLSFLLYVVKCVLSLIVML